MPGEEASVAAYAMQTTSGPTRQRSVSGSLTTSSVYCFWRDRCDGRRTELRAMLLVVALFPCSSVKTDVIDAGRACIAR